jgi:hypothetical protein
VVLLSGLWVRIRDHALGCACHEIGKAVCVSTRSWSLLSDLVSASMKGVFAREGPRMAASAESMHRQCISSASGFDYQISAEFQFVKVGGQT